MSAIAAAVIAAVAAVVSRSGVVWLLSLLGWVSDREAAKSLEEQNATLRAELAIRERDLNCERASRVGMVSQSTFDAMARRVEVLEDENARRRVREVVIVSLLCRLAELERLRRVSGLGGHGSLGRLRRSRGFGFVIGGAVDKYGPGKHVLVLDRSRVPQPERLRRYM